MNPCVRLTARLGVDLLEIHGPGSESRRCRWPTMSEVSMCRLPGGQLKLCFPFGLSQTAVRSRTPFVSFHTRRFSLYGRGASATSPGRTP